MYDKQIKGLSKIIYIVFTIMLTIVLSIGLVRTVQDNNVNAATLNFDSYEYTIGFNGFEYTTVDDEDYGYTAGSFYISMYNNNTIGFTYPTIVGDWIEYKTIKLNKETTTRYRYIGDIQVAFFSNNEYTEPYYSEQGVITYTISQIDFYCLTSDYSEFFNSIEYYDGYEYGSYPSVKRYYKFANGTTKYGELYLTTPNMINPSTTLYASAGDLIKIDRSEYVKTIVQEKEVYVNGVESFSGVFNSVRNGVEAFLDFRIFNDFTLGHVFAIVLSLSCFIFIIHLLKK